MKCVILAAGRGSRLKPITSYIPKPLLPVNHGRVIDRVINYLSCGCKEILLVTGHLHELLERYIVRRYPNVKLVNVDRITPGNLHTLLQVRDFLSGEEFVIANADHIFPEEVWNFFPKKENSLELACHSSGTRAFLEDEMKVKVKNSKLVRMDKKLENYEGAYTGLAYVGKDSTDIFWESAEKVSAQRRDEAKVEDVFNLLAEKEVPEVVWIDNIRFYEIDTIEDLRRVWNEAKAGSF